MHAFEFLRARRPGRPSSRSTPSRATTPTSATSRSRRSPGRRSGPTPTTWPSPGSPGDQASLADVLDEVRTLPFLARCRVVIVEGADPFVTAHRKELEAYAEKPSTLGRPGPLGQVVAGQHQAGQAGREGRAGGRVQDARRARAARLAGPARQEPVRGQARRRRRPAPGRAGRARGRPAGLRGREALRSTSASEA